MSDIWEKWVLKFLENQPSASFRVDKSGGQIQFTNNFICPFCGDNERRSWLVYGKKGRKPFYQCFRGICVAKGMDAWKALAAVTKQDKTRLMLEVGMSMIDIVSADSVGREEVIEKDAVLPKDSIEITVENLQEHSKGPERETLKAICHDLERRYINKAPMCPDLYVVIPEKWDDTNWMWRYRYIIPFRNHMGRLKYAQGRTVNLNEEIKYYGTKIEGEKPFFNVDRLDKPKQIALLEGPIDSMFLPNSVAFGNSFPSEESLYKLCKTFSCSVDNLVYFPDNPYMDKTGKENLNKALKMGLSIFMWSDRSMRTCKDINDYIILKKNPYYFVENDYIKMVESGFSAKIKLKMENLI